MEPLSSAPNSGWISFFKDFWSFLGKYRHAYFGWTLVAFVVFFYQLLPPYLVGLIVDFFTRYQPGNDLTWAYLLILSMALFHALAALIRLTTKHKLVSMITYLRTDRKIEAFDHLLAFSLTWHEQENTGNKVERITKGLNNLGAMQRLLNTNVFEIITGISGALVFFFFQIPVLGLFVLLYMVVYLSINHYFYRHEKKLELARNLAQEQSAGRYYEGMSNITTLKAHGYHTSFQSQIRSVEEKQRDIQLRINRINNNKWKVFQIVNSICTFGFYAILVQFLIRGQISVGLIFTFHAYFFVLMRLTGTITEISEQLLEIKISFERMVPLFQLSKGNFFGKAPFPAFWSAISMHKSAFSYQHKDKLFELIDVDFDIQRGHKIGIAGHSGSGKSTLAKLLLGLYKIDSGDFLIDRRSFYDLEHEEVTRHFALVLQESELFNFSLYENITLLRDVSPELLEKAIRISQLENFISKLPEGLNTLIGEKGYRVSGGERQRIAIARAIAKDPDIFIFDEATSQLDSKTESVLQLALEGELTDKTMLFIAHRLSTLRNMDVIYVFDQGKIVQKGSFEELINTEGSVFQELYRLQMRQVNA